MLSASIKLLAESQSQVYFGDSKIQVNQLPIRISKTDVTEMPSVNGVFERKTLPRMNDTLPPEQMTPIRGKTNSILSVTC